MVLPAWSALMLVLAVCPLMAQQAPLWDDSVRVTLPGSVHPRLARLEPLGPVSPDQPMEKMIFVLKQSPEAKAKADQLLRDQQDPASPSYHHWLTPDQFGAQFGPSKAQLDAAASWLTQQGFTVHGASRGGLSISFSGTAAQVGKAFRTAIMEYDVDGVRRHGNATAISIPQGLTGFAAGVASLNDMPRKHYTVSYCLKSRTTRSSPEVDTTQGNAVGAGDFATIYDLNPLFPGTTGKGVTIAVVGETNITLSDQTSFVSNFNLTQYGGSFAVVTPGADPGILTDGEEIEADVDTQWSAAAAPGANIRLVIFPSTLTTQGVDLSAQYIVDNQYAPILTLSYGECENALGTAGNAFWAQLWEQAASEGISVFAASGDSGAAGCDAAGDETATHGRAVSGIASTPYNTCVGGTMFSGDSSNDPNAYWLANDTSLSLYAETAKGYIPETVWNETSAANGIAGSGGGASTIYARPAWQVAYGVPASPLMRLVPDVAFNAAGGHDPYLVIQDGQAYGIGGTSVATPSMAGIMALVVQRFGSQGNANFTLYSLGKAQYNNVYASGPAAPAVFHNITTGNNSVTGVAGYFATGGYSEATGLGSLDAAVLVSNWAPALNPISVTPLPATLSVASGHPHTFSGSASENGATLTYSWDFGDGTIAAGASLSHTYTITGNQPQVFWAVLTVSDGTYVQSSSTQVTVTPPSPVSAAIVLPVTSVSVLPNIPIAFTATASTSANGATITSYAWSFGDNSTGSGASTSHSFADSPDSFYTVTLTATDSLGNSGEGSVQIYADTSVMDVAGNGTVDVRDLLAIAGAWGVTATPTNFNGINFAADLNGAAGITDTDLTLWMTNFMPEVIQ